MDNLQDRVWTFAKLLTRKKGRKGTLACTVILIRNCILIMAVEPELKFPAPERFGPLKTKHLCNICTTCLPQKLRLWKRNPNVRLWPHHLTNFGSGPPKLLELWLHSPAFNPLLFFIFQSALFETLRKVFLDDNVVLRKEDTRRLLSSLACDVRNSLMTFHFWTPAAPTGKREVLTSTPTRPKSKSRTRRSRRAAAKTAKDDTKVSEMNDVFERSLGVRDLLPASNSYGVGFFESLRRLHESSELCERMASCLSHTLLHNRPHFALINRFKLLGFRDTPISQSPLPIHLPEGRWVCTTSNWWVCAGTTALCRFCRYVVIGACLLFGPFFASIVYTVLLLKVREPTSACNLTNSTTKNSFISSKTKSVFKKPVLCLKFFWIIDYSHLSHKKFSLKSRFRHNFSEMFLWRLNFFRIGNIFVW